VGATGSWCSICAGVAITDKLDPEQVANLVAQGLELGTYRYDRYIAEDKRRPATVQRVTCR
jgi:hypothetical protein